MSDLAETTHTPGPSIDPDTSLADELEKRAGWLADSGWTADAILMQRAAKHVCKSVAAHAMLKALEDARRELWVDFCSVTRIIDAAIAAAKQGV